MGKGLKGLVIGGAIGAALGLLYAPRAGKKTRAILAEKTEMLWGEEAQKQGTILGEVAKTTQTAISAGQSIFEEASKGPLGDITEKGTKFVKDAKDKAEDFTTTNVRPVFSEKNDELRKKIDAARQKIASQVAKNIDEHKPSVDVEPASVKTKPIEPAEKKPAKKTTKKKTTKKADSKKNSKK